MHPTLADRRRFARYVLPPAYCPVRVRTLDRDEFDNCGHAYDVSAGGLRFELDHPVAPGTEVALHLMLPGQREPDGTPGRGVFAFARIIWIADEEEPGPVRTAAVFTRFARPGDEDRLALHLGSGRYRLAA